MPPAPRRSSTSNEPTAGGVGMKVPQFYSLPPMATSEPPTCHNFCREIPPMVRDQWIAERSARQAAAGTDVMTQLHFARKGEVTQEMQFVAEREGVEAEQIRAELAVGRLIIPANIRHPELEPMAIGVATRCKINANIGNSALTSNHDAELEKLHVAVHYGADTVMDLSTGGDIPSIREGILRHSPVPIGTVPLYEALSKDRITGIVSRGGAILAEWMVENNAENPLFGCFDDICKIFRKYDVSFS